MPFVKHARRRKSGKIMLTVTLAIVAVIFIIPLVLSLADSFMSEQEISDNYGMVTSGAQSGSGENNQDVAESEGFANMKFIPDIVTLSQYYTVLIKRLQFLIMFWNSARLVIPIIAGQVFIASMAAYAFAKLKFPGRDKLFFLYIIVMLMPFQVTLVPNYIIADKLALIGSRLSIILPGIFGTFGVFLLRQFMQYIPDEYLESAKVDGASQGSIFFKIILPMTKAGLAALAILLFIDNWNMVEQPVIFLQDVNLQPLSIYLSSINSGERGIAFAASSIYMAPMILCFLYWESYLIEGIQLSGLKG